MTKNTAIIAPEKGTVSTVALAVLCTFALVQSIALFRALGRPSTAPASPSALPPAAVLPATPPAFSVPTVPSTPHQPASLVPGLPGGMTMPVGGQPSLPAATSAPLSNPLPPSAAAPIPPLPTAANLAPTPAPPRSIPPPASAPSPAAVSRTGNAQTDELVETAQQLRELKEYAGAVEALERADLIAPDNVVVLRELMVTYQLHGQTDKAAAVSERLSLIGNKSQSAAPAASFPAEAVATQPVANGPMKLGTIEVLRDLTVLSGQRLALRIPLIVAPGVPIDPDAYNLDVFFYDQVNGVPAYPTIADPPVKSHDGAFDFKQGLQEIIKIVYHLPELTPADVAAFGQRTYLGYVVKLYYQGKLMSVAAEPSALLNYRAPASGAGSPQ